jgi:hypothetical protein
MLRVLLLILVCQQFAEISAVRSVLRGTSYARAFVRKRQTTVKKPAQKTTGSRTRGRRAPANEDRPSGDHRRCAFCSQRSDHCQCHRDAPEGATLNLTRFREYVRFLESRSGQRRRFLTDCLDVVMVVTWTHAFLLVGGSMRDACMAMIAFRLWNRLTNWPHLITVFDNPRRVLDWKIMEDVAGDCKQKPFSRPVRLRAKGRPAPADPVQNKIVTLRTFAAHASLLKAARLLQAGVSTPEQYEQLLTTLDELRRDIPGTFAPYRQKNFLDLCVALKAIHPNAMTRFLVSPKSGTDEALLYLYDLDTASEDMLSKLLNHLFATVRKSKAGMGRALVRLDL